MESSNSEGFPDSETGDSGKCLKHKHYTCLFEITQLPKNYPKLDSRSPGFLLVNCVTANNLLQQADPQQPHL